MNIKTGNIYAKLREFKVSVIMNARSSMNAGLDKNNCRMLRRASN